MRTAEKISTVGELTVEIRSKDYRKELWSQNFSWYLLPESPQHGWVKADVPDVQAKGDFYTDPRSAITTFLWIF